MAAIVQITMPGAATKVELAAEIDRSFAFDTIVGEERINLLNYSPNTAGGDSTAALQAFFAALPGKKAFLTPGLWSTSTPLTLPVDKPYTLTGVLGNIYGAGPSHIYGGGAVLLNTGVGHLLVASNPTLADNAQSLIENLTLMGNIAGSGDNLNCDGVHHLTLRKVWSTSAAGRGGFFTNSFSNLIDDCHFNQNGAWGLQFEDLANAVTVRGGGALANGRKANESGNIRVNGQVGKENRGFRLLGVDVSYAGQNPYGGAVITDALNLLVTGTYDGEFDIYSEDGVGHALAGTRASIYIGGNTRMIGLRGYQQNRDVLVETGDLFEGRLHVLAASRNVAVKATGSTGTGRLGVSKEEVGFTVTTTKPVGWT